MKKILQSQKMRDAGLCIVRVFTGIIILKYGLELFDKDKVTGYSQWLLDSQVPLPLMMAYAGKLAEFTGGILLIAGLFTRPASIPLLICMAVVTFRMGNGKIFSDDQHPFLLLLLFAVFLCIGGGKWSVDYLLFRKKNNSHD